MQFVRLSGYYQFKTDSDLCFVNLEGEAGGMKIKYKNV